MFAVIVENDESEWEDITGEVYHYPNKYQSIIRVGLKIVYYKGGLKNRRYRENRLSDSPHYFGTATIGKIEPDPLSLKKDYFCQIESYGPFQEPVLARQDDQYLEEIPPSKSSNYWRDAVRVISEDVFNKITSQATPTAHERNMEIPPIYLENESELKDGEKKYRFSSYYERNSKIRTAAINIHGYTCMVCGFDFEEIFGDIGKNFIHVHHNKPVSDTPHGMEIDPKTDLTVLCPNCHAMIHRKKNHTLTPDELKQIIRQQS